MLTKRILHQHPRDLAKRRHNSSLHIHSVWAVDLDSPHESTAAKALIDSRPAAAGLGIEPAELVLLFFIVVVGWVGWYWGLARDFLERDEMVSRCSTEGGCSAGLCLFLKWKYRIYRVYDIGKTVNGIGISRKISCITPKDE